MRQDYYKPAEKQSMVLPAVLVLLMLLALLLAPTLAFAQAEGANVQAEGAKAASNALNAKDPMPRYLLTPKDISQAVAIELENAGFGQSVEASVYTEESNTVFGADQEMTVAVSRLEADSKGRTWTANILFKHGDAILTALPMKGRFNDMVELPVLARTIGNGQVIGKEDITTKRFPTHYQRAGVINDAEKIIGMAAKRNISQHRPIREHEISMPLIVKKNDLINLSYQSSSLSITTTGQVMADAAIGDVIAVKNINSDKTVRAVVKDSKTASVMPLMQRSTAQRTPNNAAARDAQGMQGGTYGYN